GGGIRRSAHARGGGRVQADAGHERRVSAAPGRLPHCSQCGHGLRNARNGLLPAGAPGCNGASPARLGWPRDRGSIVQARDGAADSGARERAYAVARFLLPMCGAQEKGGFVMANLTIRKEKLADPFAFFRDFIPFDPFREMEPAFYEQKFAFAPPFEVKETKQGYLFKADVPGVAERDLEVTLDGNRLLVTGKREAEREEKDETFF